MTRFRLIATDVNETLLNSAGEISARTRVALDAARAAGMLVVPATARRPVDLQCISTAAGFDAWALCGDGGYSVHLGTGAPLFAEVISPRVVRAIVENLNSRIRRLRFAAVRAGDHRIIAQRGYTSLSGAADAPDEHGVPLDTLLSTPALKLTIRHPELHPRVVFETLQELEMSGFRASVAAHAFVSVVGFGVSKASGLALLCDRLGVAQHEVVAFGNDRNDLLMLRWAGHGVAVANASADVQESADEVTESNDDDGVALVIERMLRS